MSLRDHMLASTRLAFEVKRFHTWMTIRTQTVGEHTAQMMRIWVEIFGEPGRDVWLYILWHDATEMHSGDLPYYAKKTNPDLKVAVDRIENSARLVMGLDSLTPSYKVTEYERKLVKICDLLELWEFGRDEIMMGNKFAEPIITQTSFHASQLAEELGVTDKINLWMEGHL